MGKLRNLGLVCPNGDEPDARLLQVLSDLTPRFNRTFPAIRDEADVERIYCEVIRRVEKCERERKKPLENLHGYAWATLKCVAVSFQRQHAMQVPLRTVSALTRKEVVTRLRAWHGSPEAIENSILLREAAERMTKLELWMFEQKARGYSSEDIAKVRGCSVNAVDKALSRARKRVQALARPKA